MKVIQLKLYPLEELGEKGREKALADHLQVNVDYDWWETLYRDAEDAGIRIDGFNLDRKDCIYAGFTLDAVYTAGKVTDHHGQHTDTFLTTAEFCKNRDKLLNGRPRDADRAYLRTDELAEAMELWETNYLHAISKDYFRLLSGEYDYLTSEKAISETLTANDYYFTADGKIATSLERLAEPLNITN
jgi:hypothetical protein